MSKPNNETRPNSCGSALVQPKPDPYTCVCRQPPPLAAYIHPRRGRANQRALNDSRSKAGTAAKFQGKVSAWYLWLVKV